MSTRVSILLIILLICVITSCSPGSSANTPAPTSGVNGDTLLQERCSRCHTLGRVERSRHTLDEWKAIIDKMISKGARLTAEEEAVLVEYMALNFGK